VWPAISSARSTDRFAGARFRFPDISRTSTSLFLSIFLSPFCLRRTHKSANLIGRAIGPTTCPSKWTTRRTAPESARCPTSLNPSFRLPIYHSVVAETPKGNLGWPWLPESLRVRIPRWPCRALRRSASCLWRIFWHDAVRRGKRRPSNDRHVLPGESLRIIVHRKVRAEWVRSIEIIRFVDVFLSLT